MVVVEIRRPYFDEESQTIDWQIRAVVLANSDGVKISAAPDETPCVLTETLVEASSGDVVDAASAPERWARSLPDAYRSGDLVAVVTHDDHPPAAVDSLDDGVEEPMIPEPPTPEFSETSATQTGEVTTV
jgi:hypothetical protein